jgi:large subunit ribosomal protein L10
MAKTSVIQEKSSGIDEIKAMVHDYRSIGIASLHKVRASQLQELKKKLEGKVHLKVIKNNLLKRAIAECTSKPNLKKLQEYLKESNIFLFTNLNPFKVSLLLQKNKVKATAKTGDLASEEILVSAGNTGLPPGPIISQLGSVGLSTRIESGSVWINKDTIVARKNDVISERLAIILSKLGIKGIETGLSMKTIYEDGLLISEEELKIDLEEYRSNIIEAYNHSLNLATKAEYPTVENISILFGNAYYNAATVGIESSYTSPDLISNIIKKAYSEALLMRTIVDKGK